MKKVLGSQFVVIGRVTTQRSGLNFASLPLLHLNPNNFHMTFAFRAQQVNLKTNV